MLGYVLVQRLGLRQIGVQKIGKITNFLDTSMTYVLVFQIAQILIFPANKFVDYLCSSKFIVFSSVVGRKCCLSMIAD
ncbi:hypothetical protein C8024_04205 [Sphingopyxis sp. BSNA05]|nr:hypothetical protein [Sphingopyxis sp. BSNA05]